jgi:hypothetical protein
MGVYDEVVGAEHSTIALDAQVQKLRSALRLREERVAAEQAKALEVEAEILELSKDADVKGRLVSEQQIALDDRISRVTAREAETAARSRRFAADHEKASSQNQAQQREVEVGWRRLEEAIVAHETAFASEQGRLRRQFVAAEDRDAIQREKERALAEQEQDVSARQRQSMFHSAQVRDIERSVMERMQSELNDREMLLQEADN